VGHGADEWVGQQVAQMVAQHLAMRLQGDNLSAAVAAGAAAVTAAGGAAAGGNLNAASLAEHDRVAMSEHLRAATGHYLTTSDASYIEPAPSVHEIFRAEWFFVVTRGRANRRVSSARVNFGEHENCFRTRCLVQRT